MMTERIVSMVVFSLAIVRPWRRCSGGSGMADTALFPDPRLVELLRGMNAAMPPWDAYRGSTRPGESEFTGLVTGDLIAPHDVRRVVLIVSVQQTSDSARITTKPGVESGRGVLLTGNQGPWILTHQSHGLLTQVDWFVASRRRCQGFA
jgi:hypothetical protein